MSWPPPTERPLMSPERIIGHAAEHSFSLASFDFEAPIDRTRLFLCPTLTPLYYTDVYSKLSASDAMRYNQLTAMCFSEMIGFFEAAFTNALKALDQDAGLSGDLLQCVRRFIGEEAKHQEMWKRLNRLSEPDWYHNGDRRIVRIPRVTRSALGWLTRHPRPFPVVVWMMLALEEHSMEIGRRCLRLPADSLEPRYRMAYRVHMEEEVRHIHTDFNLLGLLLGRLSARQCRTTAWLFRRTTSAFFLKPKRAAVRVIDLLCAERRTVRPLRRTMIQQLKMLDRHPEFVRMMLSPEATPMTFELLQRVDNLSGAGPAS